MKTIFKKIATISAIAFALIVCFSTTINASVGTKEVEKGHYLDVNKFNFTNTAWGYYKINVPSSARYMYTDYIEEGGGWNYDRYHVINYYESDLGWH